MYTERGYRNVVLASQIEPIANCDKVHAVLQTVENECDGMYTMDRVNKLNTTQLAAVKQARRLQSLSLRPCGDKKLDSAISACNADFFVTFDITEAAVLLGITKTHRPMQQHGCRTCEGDCG